MSSMRERLQKSNEANRKPVETSVYEENIKKNDEQVIYLDINQIHENPLNNGMSMNGIDGLAENILVCGQIEPLICVKDTDGKYKIVSGERRYRAMKKLVEEGKVEKGFKVKVIELNIENVDLPVDNEMKELLYLVSANKSREKTDGDLLFEIEALDKVYKELKAAGTKTFISIVDNMEKELTDRRQFISEMGNISRTKVAQITAIQQNADKEDIEKIKKGEKTLRSVYENKVRNKDKQHKSEYSLDKELFKKDSKVIEKMIKNEIELSPDDFKSYKMSLEQIKIILKKYE